MKRLHKGCQIKLTSRQNLFCYCYRVILKKVSFGIFAIILVSKEDKNFTIESKGKGLSLSRFSFYLAIVKIIQIGRLNGHISQKNHDFKIVFVQKSTIHCCCT